MGLQFVLLVIPLLIYRFSDFEAGASKSSRPESRDYSYSDPRSVNVRPVFAQSVMESSPSASVSGDLQRNVKHDRIRLSMQALPSSRIVAGLFKWLPRGQWRCVLV